MGIPSYFSYLLKRQRHIIRPVPKRAKYDSLYLDCNSIVYDSYYSLEPTTDTKTIESTIINDTIKRIKQLISQIGPRNILYIAFDGVAPVAKMEQQKTRRYKSWIISKLGMDQSKSNHWNTSSITPGTEFMSKLMTQIKDSFCHKESTWNVRNIIVSGSDEPGEGEHKLFSYMRANSSKDQVAVYGLDADLIMLSLVHTKYCSNIHICREAPAFGDLRGQEQEHTLLGVDTNKLMKSIYDEMGCGGYIHARVLDYIFICFLLGNDFMPHFPAINIRTQGIRVLMDAYTKVINNSSNGYNYLVSSETGIYWPNVVALLKNLSDNERGLLIDEYEQRLKMAEYYEKAVHDMSRKEQWEYIPLLYRSKEMYIYPMAAYWESRYYETLFPKDAKTDMVTQNYMEGLEWVFRYYTSGCPDWRWKYNYNYAPLLVDLYRTVSKTAAFPKFSSNNTYQCVTPEEQLKYVLPRSQWGELIPGFKYPKDYAEEPLPRIPEVFEWSFCKYMWEAHVKTH